VKSLDLSIVIANAGLLHIGKFLNIDAAKLQQHLDVNVYHYTMMAKVFIPKLIGERASYQSAFVAVSSSSCLRYMPSFLTYTGTKAFATQLTLAVE
jgi:short-subunit dehydrogenase